ncbi:MAG: hypothetical protein KKD11_07480 [Candidatus Omnitrophica bacterium]|nr:hypothetical protein [Candidatus Omnitrophota bacterium]
MIKLLLSAILFLSLNVYADSPKCNILDLYTSGIVDEIKRNVMYFSVPPENCAGCASSVIPILDCQEIASHKFLVIAQFPASPSGENVYIAIDSKPMRYFKLWMYPIGEDIYQMRLLKEVTIKADEEFFINLKTNYSKFWQGF